MQEKINQVEKDLIERARVYEPKEGENISKVFILPPDIELNPFLLKILIFIEIQIIIMALVLAYHIFY